MDEKAKQILAARLPGRVRLNEPLAALTTFGLGGPASALAQPETTEELADALAWARETGAPCFLLGGGSNVLFSDEGFDGLVIRLGRGFGNLNILDAVEGLIRLAVGAAVPLGKLVGFTRQEGFSGLEFLAGIPGWVGGALAMNAGAYGGVISQALESLTILDGKGNRREISKKDLKADYRRLELPANAIVTSAVFVLSRSTREIVDLKVREILAKRQVKEPRGVKSAGCVFKNPTGEHAGRLIEAAGLKGRSFGGAWVAEEHANFIVHRGEASASDVLELVEIVRAEVKSRFAVDLEPEIRIVNRVMENAGK